MVFKFKAQQTRARNSKGNEMSTINFKVISTGVLPLKSTPGSAAYDIYAAEGGTIKAGGGKVFLTGLIPDMPEGWVMLLFSRSGMGFNNDIRLSNSVGVIDSDYRGEIKVKLRNDSDVDYHVLAGDRIAQAMFMRVPEVQLMRVASVSGTQRGEGGFGSTGD